MPALDPWCVANFGLKYRKRVWKLFVFERSSKSNCDIPMSIPTCDTLFPSITEPPLFWSSKLIHLVDCRKVEEVGIIEHLQLHPDTLLSTTSLRESPIVGKCVCEGLSLRCGAHGEGVSRFYGAHFGSRVYVLCVRAW